MARRDLLEVLGRRDQEIAGELEALLAVELGGAHPQSGDGAGRDRDPDRAYRPDQPPAAALLARKVPGVVEVRFAEA